MNETNNVIENNVIGSYVDVKSICPNWVTDNFLAFMNLRLEDCKWKNITSIGWWFWIFEMDSAKNGAKVTVVDPMFMDDNTVNVKLKENIDWMENKMRRISNSFELEKYKNEIKEALKKCKNEEKWKYEEKLDCYTKHLEEREIYIDRRKIILKHLKNWQENQKKYWLVLNPSIWNHIEWIDSDSQDIVLIAHTLSHIYNKSSWNIRDFIEQWYKILKTDWKLWIIDYVWNIKFLNEILQSTKLKIYYKVNKWSFVCCFDKEWLDKFLKYELK